MSDVRQDVLTHLSKTFPTSKVVETKTGIKFNVQQLDNDSLLCIDTLPCKTPKIVIKRSGTGLVILLNDIKS